MASDRVSAIDAESQQLNVGGIIYASVVAREFRNRSHMRSEQKRYTKTKTNYCITCACVGALQSTHAPPQIIA